jgi:hypothetical protein
VKTLTHLTRLIAGFETGNDDVSRSLVTHNSHDDGRALSVMRGIEEEHINFMTPPEIKLN